MGSRQFGHNDTSSVHGVLLPLGIHKDTSAPYQTRGVTGGTMPPTATLAPAMARWDTNDWRGF
jgi:hypothetical protein